VGAADDDGDDDDGDDGGDGGSGSGGGTATRACTPVEVTPAQSLRELALIRELTLTIGVPCDESAVPSESAAQEQQDSLATARARIQLLEKELLVALKTGPMKKAQIKAEIKAEMRSVGKRKAPYEATERNAPPDPSASQGANGAIAEGDEPVPLKKQKLNGKAMARHKRRAEREAAEKRAGVQPGAVAGVRCSFSIYI
jgi:hypothetical protein